MHGDEWNINVRWVNFQFEKKRAKKGMKRRVKESQTLREGFEVLFFTRK